MTASPAACLLLLSSVLLAGCEGCADDSERPTGGSSAPSSQAASGGEDPAEPPSPGPPPEVRVRVEKDRYERLTVAVENRGTEPARLAAALAVEGRTGDGFDDRGELVLAPDCETPGSDDDEAACATLVPGAVLYPCDCGGCDELGSGVFRFVARSCGGDHALESAPITLER